MYLSPGYVPFTEPAAMFEAAAWDDDSSPQLSALTWSMARSREEEAGKKKAKKGKVKSEGKTGPEQSWRRKSATEFDGDSSRKKKSKNGSDEPDEKNGSSTVTESKQETRSGVHVVKKKKSKKDKAKSDVTKLNGIKTESKLEADVDKNVGKKEKSKEVKDSGKRTNSEQVMLKKGSIGSRLEDVAKKDKSLGDKVTTLEVDQPIGHEVNTLSLVQSLNGGKDSKKKKSKSLSSLPSVTEVNRKLSNSLDKMLNSPGASRALLEEQPCSPGSLLTRGIKFSSSAALLRFIGMPAKKRGKKRGKDDDDEGEEEQLEGEENPAFSVETPRVREEAVADSSSSSSSPPPGKRRKHSGLDLARLKEHLAAASQDLPSSPQATSTPQAEAAKLKLCASRFRYLNEQLYCQEGSASSSMFRNDPSLFASYHTGYQIQAKQWPMDPLNIVIADIRKLPKTAVIADFGCGEARLAESLPNKVHSFDLVAANDSVTACDMSKVPLESASVDVAVFCLALMGTNTRDFIYEASRVLRVSGTLKVAELESRFQGQDSDVDKFISDVEKFGFKNSWKDLKKDFFYFLDFQKVKDVKKKKLPEIVLKPCLYKKR